MRLRSGRLGWLLLSSALLKDVVFSIMPVCRYNEAIEKANIATQAIKLRLSLGLIGVGVGMICAGTALPMPTTILPMPHMLMLF